MNNKKYLIKYSESTIINKSKNNIRLINGGNINLKEDYIFNGSNATTKAIGNLSLQQAVFELNKNINIENYDISNKS